MIPCVRLLLMFGVVCLEIPTVTAAEPALPSSKSAPALTPAIAAMPVEEVERLYQGTTTPEGARMLLAILKGSNMGPGEGWFGPAESRFGWEWLARRCGMSADEIPAKAFPGDAVCFARLDRDGDGVIRPSDLDWSDRNPWVQQSYLVGRLFRRMDPKGDGRISREDWLTFFESAAGQKDSIELDDLRNALLGGGVPGLAPGDLPEREAMIRGLFTGELGAISEGPRVDDIAPDFALQTVSGDRTIRLSEQIGPKPVVLVFGNYTCPPFRAMYPGVEAVYRRFQDRATFLAVYVREAHPTDGWCMESNTKIGVSTHQPRTYAERVGVATKCGILLKPSMPLLVDDITDPVGNAYSGMPSRLYVIDRTGKVAYKSGRGPFGFKVGEMEQALVMTLME